MTEITDAEAAEVLRASGEQEQPAAHVHDWQVLKSEEVCNPTTGPSAFGWQTVALLRCAECGDVTSRVLAGRWSDSLAAADLDGRPEA